MSDDDGSFVSRRNLLYGLTMVGLGAGTGAVTTARWSDTEQTGGEGFATLTTGTVALDVTDGPLSLGIPEQNDTSKSESVTASVPGTSQTNPARVWFRTNCPTGTELEDKLRLTVGYDSDCTGSVDRDIKSDTLPEVLTYLRENPVLLDGNPGSGSDEDPLDVGEQVCLLFELERTDGFTGGQTTTQTIELALEFHAEQVRYAPKDPPESWKDETCDEGGT